MSERYKITHDIEHSCCYTAGVVDTQGYILDDRDRYGQNKVICECIDTETAELICKALNALPAKSRP